MEKNANMEKIRKNEVNNNGIICLRDKGFLEKGEVEPAVTSPVPDYAWPGIKDEGLATSAAGMAGTLVTFGFGLGFGILLKKRR